MAYRHLIDTKLAEALKPILTDLAATGQDVPKIADGSWPREESRVGAWVVDNLTGSAVGIAVSVADSLVQRVLDCSDVVQEWVCERQWARGESVGWPECPRHLGSHPLRVAREGGDAVWKCPVDDVPIAPIGQLNP